MKKIIKWDKKDILKTIFGSILYCSAINLFIVPNNLFSGGVLGLSQLIRTLIVNYFNINISFDVAGIFYYMINIPLFIFAYKKVSKDFFIKSLIAVSMQSLLLTLIPSPVNPLVDNVLVCVLIGGILSGIGCGLTLSGGASTGGTDIIGIVISKDNNSSSVGKIALCINTFIYSITGLLYGIEKMIYSILNTIFDSLALDKFHEQNICTSAILFCKDNPKKIFDYIKYELKRGYTTWDAIGGYEDTKTIIIYVALSKRELQCLERFLKNFNQVFMVESNNVNIKGDFQKKF